jgi:hypothetical protein
MPIRIQFITDADLAFQFDADSCGSLSGSATLAGIVARFLFRIFENLLFAELVVVAFFFYLDKFNAYR